MSDSQNYAALLADYYLGRKSSHPHPRNFEEFRRTISADDLALIPHGKRILNAGAGNGYFARLLQEAGNDVICLEIVPELIRLCQANGLLKLIQADLNKPLPFQTASFDVVISRTVVEHLFNPWCFFLEAYRVLTFRGELVVTTSNKSYVGQRIRYAMGDIPLSMDIKDFTSRNLRRALESAGFVVEVRPFLGRHPLARFARRFWVDFSPAIVGIGRKV